MACKGLEAKGYMYFRVCIVLKLHIIGQFQGAVDDK